MVWPYFQKIPSPQRRKGTRSFAVTLKVRGDLVEVCHDQEILGGGITVLSMYRQFGGRDTID